MWLLMWAMFVLFAMAISTGDPLTTLFFGGLWLICMACLPTNSRHM